TLVYGGANVGLMRVVADAAMAGGGKVVGVMPKHLVDREKAHGSLSELHVVASMHERKALMARLSDGFIALPGGAGTMEELFETWTWQQLGLHGKPCGLLNVASYYDPLVAFLDHAVSAGFIRAIHRDMLVVEATPEGILSRFAAYPA
ncbi:MAG TPA: TIGR00730 family Rossman fold protein, partial [Holophaga sp.]|nr:TIGR00730 family Rossman fold protein [Holophaga sp.]